MSIDATILAVERDGDDVVLALGPRIDDSDKTSVTGQRKLRIVNATWQPEPGMDIWGGSSSVQIITKRGARDPVTNNAIGPWYRREGYTRLHEIPTERSEQIKGADFTYECGCYWFCGNLVACKKHRPRPERSEP